MKPSVSYHDYLMERLKDSEEAAAYLSVALEEGDYRMFLVALRNVAEAHGGMLQLSRKTKLSRPNLYRMLSKKGRPEITSLEQILKTFGLALSISPIKESYLKKSSLVKRCHYNFCPLKACGRPF